MTVDGQLAARRCIGPLSRFARNADTVVGQPEVGSSIREAKGPRA